MNWTFYLALSFLCLVICEASHDDCNCDGSQTENSCTCDHEEDSYQERASVIAIVSVLAVGVIGIIIGCCVCNRKSRSKLMELEQDTSDASSQDSKYPLPDMDTWTSHSLPQIFHTPLPYYHPDQHDSSIMAPPPYSESF